MDDPLRVPDILCYRQAMSLNEIGFLISNLINLVSFKNITKIYFAQRKQITWLHCREAFFRIHIKCRKFHQEITMIANPPLHVLILIAIAGLYAGLQNALAGGGSFITFPALLLAGLNPLAANMTSTIALFPSQIASAVAGRENVSGVAGVKFRSLFIVSLIGGAVGAVLLLSTSASIFDKLLPWLVLFATSAFAWGSFGFKPDAGYHQSKLPPGAILLIQGMIAIYGGYFGGGIGFLMLAALTIAGQQVRAAAATKNALAMVMNGVAVLIFAFSPMVNWPAVVALGLGGVIGGLAGGWLIHRLPEKVLRGFVVLVGVTLTIWLFVRD
jgi:uncharacterized membrane protein YfcA